MKAMTQGRARGFTLLEVVVAMAILGVGLVVVIELLSGGLRLARVSEEHTRAAGHARMKWEEISLARTLPEGTQEGEFDSDFRWRLEVKKVDLMPPGKETSYRPPVALYRIRIEVLWRSGLREKATSLESYRVLKEEASEETS